MYNTKNQYQELMSDHMKHYVGQEVAVEVCRDGVCKVYTGNLAYVGDDFAVLEMERHEHSLAMKADSSSSGKVEAEQWGGLYRVLLPLLLIGAFYPRRPYPPYPPYQPPYRGYPYGY